MKKLFVIGLLALTVGCASDNNQPKYTYDETYNPKNLIDLGNGNQYIENLTTKVVEYLNYINNRLVNGDNSPISLDDFKGFLEIYESINNVAPIFGTSYKVIKKEYQLINSSCEVISEDIVEYQFIPELDMTKTISYITDNTFDKKNCSGHSYVFIENY